MDEHFEVRVPNADLSKEQQDTMAEVMDLEPSPKGILGTVQKEGMVISFMIPTQLAVRLVIESADAKAHVEGRLPSALVSKANLN